MNKNNTQSLGISRLKNLNQKLDDMKVHIPKPKTGKIEDEADLVIRLSRHHPQRLDVMQDIRLHSFSRLLMRIMVSHPDNINRMIVLVRTSDIALSRAILRHESLIVRRDIRPETDCFASSNDGLLDLSLFTPVDGGDKHVNGFNDVEVSGAKKSKNSGVGMISQKSLPETVIEVLWRLILEMVKKITSLLRCIMRNILPREAKQMNPGFLKTALLLDSEVTASAWFRRCRHVEIDCTD